MISENNADEHPILTIIYRPSKEDHYTLIKNIRSFRLSKNTRMIKTISVIAYPLLFNWIFTHFFNLTINIILTVICTVSVLFLTEWGNRAYYKSWAYKEYNKNNRLQENSIIEIYSNKFIEKAESGILILKFVDIYKFEETNDNFLLYESPAYVRGIPKRIFTSQDLNKARECFKNIINHSEFEYNK